MRYAEVRTAAMYTYASSARRDPSPLPFRRQARRQRWQIYRPRPPAIRVKQDSGGDIPSDLRQAPSKFGRADRRVERAYGTAGLISGGTSEVLLDERVERCRDVGSVFAVLVIGARRT